MNDSGTPSSDKSSSGAGDKSGRYPYIRPKDLPPAERLEVDAEDVEDFVEHFTNPEEHEKAHRSERAKKLTGKGDAATGDSAG